MIQEEDLQPHGASLGLHGPVRVAELKSVFAQRVRDHLRIVLSFASDAATLQRRMYSYPALRRKCWLKHLVPWNDETLEMAARHIMDQELSKLDSEKDTDAFVKGMVQMHHAQQHPSGRRFVACVRLFCRLARENAADVQRRMTFLKVQWWKECLGCQ